MEYRKLKLQSVTRQALSSKSPRITVRGYTGEFNKLGKALLAEVCKAWGLPVNHPAALELHTPEDVTEYQLLAVPVQVANDGDLRVSVNEDSTKTRVDLLNYMHSINLHLGKRTKWIIYLKVDKGVGGHPCLFLDTQTDLTEIRRQKAAEESAGKSGPQATA